MVSSVASVELDSMQSKCFRVASSWFLVPLRRPLRSREKGETYELRQETQLALFWSS